MDAFAFDESTGLKVRRLDYAGLEARLESAEPGYYQKFYREERPDCQGTCFYGKCTIIAMHPGCCWAGPVLYAEGPFTHVHAANTGGSTDDGDDDSDGDKSVAASVSADMHYERRGFFRDSLRGAKPWLCWS